MGVMMMAIHATRLTGTTRAVVAQEYRKLYGKGFSVRDIQHMSGRSYGSVHSLLTEGSTPMRRSSIGNALRSGRDKLLADLRRDYESGESLRALASSYGYTYETTRQLVHMSGADIRPARPPWWNGSAGTPKKATRR